MRLLALLPPQCEEDKEPLVVCGLRIKQFQYAGRAFYTWHERPLIEAKQKTKRGGGSRKDEAASDDERDAPGQDSWKKKKKEGGSKSSQLKLSSVLQGCDLYGILDVTESASLDQIKKQYRKMVLLHHPDKQGGDGGGGASKSKTVDQATGLADQDTLFIKIQEAYEVLCDQDKRRQYDSTLDFDESVPEQIDATLGFYGTFAPAFQRNARWSTRTPVPDLGDEKTDLAKVHKFYDFWLSFDTWRDFSMHDEYTLEEAEFREERRWMEKQNQKGRKKYENDERRRVLKLVEAAERLDPRLRAEREEKEAKKREEKERWARQKEEEEAAKRKKEEEKKQREEDLRRKEEEREKEEKEQRKQKTQAAKAMRQRLKKILQAPKCKFTSTDMEEVQEMCLALEADVLESLCVKLEALSPSEAAAAARTETKEWAARRVAQEKELERQKQEARRAEEQRAKEAKDAAAAAACGPPWSPEELSLLSKGLIKFPGGIGGRWQLLSEFLIHNGHQRSEAEVVAKTKEMSEGASLRSMGARLQAEAGLGSFQAPKAKAAPKAAANSAPAESAKPGADAPAEWSVEQQKALEAALQKHPATLDKNERWRLIADDVPGKTKSECVARFKHLREQVSKKS